MIEAAHVFKPYLYLEETRKLRRRFSFIIHFPTANGLMLELNNC